MIRMLCITGVISLTAALPMPAQGSAPADSASAMSQYLIAPPSQLPCRTDAYMEPGAGPGPLYAIGDLLVGGDSTVPGYAPRMPVYVKGNDVDRVDVLKGPAAVALYGCRARDGVVRIELKPEVKQRPEWRGIYRSTFPPLAGKVPRGTSVAQPM